MSEDERLKSIALAIMSCNSSLVCNQCSHQNDCKTCAGEHYGTSTELEKCNTCSCVCLDCRPENMMKEFIAND